MSWDTTSPQGSDFISLGDDEIRTLKTDIQTALRGNAATGTEAIFPGSDVANPVFRYRGLKGTTGARPAFGQYGLYINTTLNTLQRDSGSAWEDVATLIPSGTKMPFYQASPPTGWTAVAVNDKFMRVVTSAGTGGTSGGSGATPSSTITLAHTHTVASHTHSVSAHTHNLDYTTYTDLANSFAGSLIGNDADGDNGAVYNSVSGAGGSTTKRVFKSGTTSNGGGSSGSATPATDSQLTNTAFQYADFCVGTKD